MTKTHGPDAVEAARGGGMLDVGENKVQEALDKQDALAGNAALAEVRWHLIGHLQRNKVKFLDRFSILHALDSSRLADAVHESAAARPPGGVLLAGERCRRGNKGRLSARPMCSKKRNGCWRCGVAWCAA